ncbi:MAG: hypothetical protein IT380_04560 [Myxococcales bacterium]|nr:hypothetical protein [Myxococcales bacterium]
MRSLLVLVALGFSATACVTPVSFDAARQRVLLRASFELACSPDKLQVQELATDEVGPVYLGVSGCARRAVYVRLNTASGPLFLNDTVPPTEDARAPGAL